MRLEYFAPESLSRATNYSGAVVMPRFPLLYCISSRPALE
jgi:hypothetical protein